MFIVDSLLKMASKINILGFPSANQNDNTIDAGLLLYHAENDPIHNNEQTDVERELLRKSTENKHIIIGIDLSGSMTSPIDENVNQPAFHSAINRNPPQIVSVPTISPPVPRPYAAPSRRAPPTPARRAPPAPARRAPIAPAAAAAPPVAPAAAPPVAPAAAAPPVSPAAAPPVAAAAPPVAAAAAPPVAAAAAAPPTPAVAAPAPAVAAPAPAVAAPAPAVDQNGSSFVPNHTTESFDPSQTIGSLDLSQTINGRYYRFGHIIRRMFRNTKKDVVKDAIFELIDFVWAIKGSMRLSIFAFDHETKLIVDKATSSTPIETVKDQIRDAFNKFGGYTDMLGCLNNIIDMIHKEDIENCNIFLLTDGYNSDQLSNPVIARKIREEKIFNRITCYGIGRVGCYDEELLKTIGANVLGCASNKELLDNIVGTVYSKCSSLLNEVSIKISCNNIITTLDAEQNPNETIVKIPSFGFSQLIPVFCNDVKNPLICDITYKYRGVTENHRINICCDGPFDTTNALGIKHYCMLQKRFVDEVANATKKTPMEHKVTIGEIENEMSILLHENKIPTFMTDRFIGMMEDVNKYYRGLRDYACDDITTFSRYCGIGALTIKSTVSCSSSPSVSRSRTNAMSVNPQNLQNTSVPASNACECKVCLADPISVIFLPCRHVACCDNCSMKLIGGQCPICKQSISDMARFILPEDKAIMCQKCGVRTIKTVNKPCMHAALCHDCAIIANSKVHHCEICDNIVSRTLKIFRA